MNIDELYIKRCIELAKSSLKNGDYFFGALITHNEKIIIEAKNTVRHDITGHAEINALKRLRDKFPDIDPSECTIYSSLEPCCMCSFLIRDVGIGRVVFSARSPYMGGYTRWDILSTTNLHANFTLNGNAKPPKISPYVLEKESSRLLDNLDWDMHKCPKQNIENIEKIITNLSKTIKDVSPRDVSDIFSKYRIIPPEHRHIPYLRDKLKTPCKTLFNKNFCQIGVEAYTNFIKLSNDRIDTNNIQDTEILQSELNNIKKYMVDLFPEKDYRHTYRVLNKSQIMEKLKQNGARGLLDSIGYRVVPRKSYMLSNMIDKFESTVKFEIKYKLNTFAFDDDEFYEILSKSSSLCYRAIHYYAKIGDCIVEIQFRAPGVDVWSSIHHETLYKPKKNISVAEKCAIDEFGIIANVVDYNETLIFSDL